jgi:hypothetical protein
MNLQPQEPGYECTDCGKGLWQRDEWVNWAYYFLRGHGYPSQPLCMDCAFKRPGLRKVEVE